MQTISTRYSSSLPTKGMRKEPFTKSQIQSTNPNRNYGKYSVFILLVSPQLVDGPLESPSFVCMYVCMYEYMYVTRYLGNCSLIFSETWQLDRTWIVNKNFLSGFLN